MLNRRQIFRGIAGSALVSIAAPARAASSGGALDATSYGLTPGAPGNQGSALARLLIQASDRGQPVFLPAGDYVISGLTLPRRVWLSGVPGATRLISAGGPLIIAHDTERLSLSGLVLEGAGTALPTGTGLIDARRVDTLSIDNCLVSGSGGYGIVLEACRGRVERSTVTTAAEAGIYAVQSRGLEIVGNTVADCGNGGILVHRWEKGEDGTIVTGNRIERISAAHGGTGQFGNGINVYRAGNVIVADNRIADCAFSAIRSNSGSNVQITGNNCARSGETAIYSEFAFEGAIISSNIVDGAANGISIVNFNEGGRMAVCSGNLVRNLSTTGPYPADPPGFGVGITVEADTAVTGNVIENAPLYGMHLGWGPFLRNVVATGNVIRQAGEGIAVTVVEGAGTAVISDNVIDGSERGAVVGHRWREAVTGDLTRPDAPTFPHLTVTRNHTG